MYYHDFMLEVQINQLGLLGAINLKNKELNFLFYSLTNLYCRNILKRYLCTPFGYQTIERMDPKALTFLQESPAGRTD